MQIARSEGQYRLRCESAGFDQHYGRDNIVHNNVFAFNREHQLMCTNWTEGRFTSRNNFYYDTRPTARSFLESKLRSVLYQKRPEIDLRHEEACIGFKLRSEIGG
jgi:hypothetical protein